MNAIDLYGRNPDFARTTFAYPYPLVSETDDAPGKRYFFKPPQSNPVFGVEYLDVPNADDNIMLIDPTNGRYRRQPGIGGLGSYQSPYVPCDELTGMDGLSGCTVNDPCQGLATDMGLGGEGPVEQFLTRASAPFKQSDDERAVRKLEAKSKAWGSWDRLGGFYQGSSSTAQTAMLVVGGLILWNLFGGRKR
jgi:hypothetical protein